MYLSSFCGCHTTYSGHPQYLVSHTVVNVSDWFFDGYLCISACIYILKYMYSRICVHLLSVCICEYIFKEQVHCKKLELNPLCQYDILLAEDILFMDFSYGCHSNKTAVSGPFCGTVWGRHCPPCAVPPASLHPLWPRELLGSNM